MRLIIAGSRTVPDDDIGMHLLQTGIDNFYRLSLYAVSEVVSGGARGADKLGERWARDIAHIPVTVVPARWDLHGRSAGYKRNVDMAMYAKESASPGAVLALWDGKSRGTRHMIEVAQREGLEVWVEIVDYL